MPRFSFFSPLVLLVFAFGLVGTGCKTQKPASGYNYLLKDDKETASKPTNTTKDPVVVHTETPVEEEPEVGDGTSKPIRKVLKEAESYLGVPYRYGGINKNGVDCSGLARNAYQAIGVQLPRSTREQCTYGTPVKRSRLRPGDLVFFSAGNTGRIDHVGIISSVNDSEVTFIHATTRKGVRFDRLDEGYWKNLFKSARRPGLH